MTTSTAASATKQLYTQEKAVHLIRVFMVILSIFGLLGWQHLIILNYLKNENLEMAHMDPSEIKSMPYSLKKLTAFVMGPLVVIMMNWLYFTPSKMMTNLFKLLRLTMVVYALFAICGSHIIDDYQHSLTAALYVAGLISTTWKAQGDNDGSTVIGNQIFSSSNILDELPFTDYSGLNIFGCCRLYGIILITIPFQILTVLDHGLQVQRWPLPIVIGSTYGYVMGSLVGIIFGYYQRQSSTKEKQ